MFHSLRRFRGLLGMSLVVLAVPLLSACSSLFRGTMRTASVAPNGLPWGEELVRRSLMLGTYEQAFVRTRNDRSSMPNDDLLRALFRGQVSYYAGRWAESAEAFAEAERLTEARYTKSASRGVLSVLTNDHALKYVPPRTERLFARYYAMMVRVQSGDVQGAAVEARRLSALLEQSRHDVDPDERATHAALREVAGGVFEAAAEWNDAGVAYRNAALLRGVPRAEVDSLLVARPLGDSATVVLVLESGFVAHYVEHMLAVPLDSREVGQAKLSHVSQFLAAMENLPSGGVFVDNGAVVSGTRYLGDRRAHRTWLEIAWPGLVRPNLPRAPVQFGLSVMSQAHAAQDSVTPGPEPWRARWEVPHTGVMTAELSDAIGADARRQRAARLARLTARTVTRVAVVEAVRDQHGEFAGLMAGFFASGLERADTRAWHLLPGRLSLVRATVPAGSVTSRLMVGAGPNALPVAISPFTARAGMVYVLPARVWRDPVEMPRTVAHSPW